MSTTVVNHASSPLLTIPEVAELLGISRVRCYEMAALGEIPSIRLSPRRIRVPQTALEAWLIERARLTTHHRPGPEVPIHRESESSLGERNRGLTKAESSSHHEEYPD